MQRTFTRQALYDLVWSTPIATLATRFDISDRGLAKICERHHVPVPGRGYWAKIEAGQPATKTPLWNIDNPDIETVHIGGFRATASPSTAAALEAADRTVKTFKSEGIRPLRGKPPAPATKKEPTVLAVVERPHDSLSGLVGALKSAKRDQYGELVVPGIRLHEGSIVRLTTVLHHLVVALVARSIAFTWDENGMHAAIDRDSVRFEIGEGRGREKHAPTPAELKQHEAYEKRRDAAQRRGQWLYHESFWPEFDYVYSGKLTLEIHNWGNGARKRWSDGKHQTLESMLEAVADGTLFHLAYEKARREEREADERRRAHMAHRRDLHKKRQEREASRLSFLHQLAEYQRESADLRSTITNASELLPHAAPEYHRMITWAEQRLAHLEAQNELDVLASNLRQQNLFPEPDDLHDPEGDPPAPRHTWGD
jgi:hypothetical protein